MTTDDEPDDADYVEEIWLFLGSRVNSKNTRTHAWVLSEDPDGRELWFRAKGHHAVGGNYRMKVQRVDGEVVSKMGDPVYVEAHPDEDLRIKVAASHRTAEITLSRLALERSQNRKDPLDKALAPLVTLAETVPPLQRDAFALYVMRKLLEIW
jgi:hypothetical protein